MSRQATESPLRLFASVRNLANRRPSSAPPDIFFGMVMVAVSLRLTGFAGLVEILHAQEST